MLVKILLDANSLLNACFLNRSWSRQAIEAANTQGDSLLVSNVALQEVRRTIQSAVYGSTVQKDPWQRLEQFCASHSVATIFCGAYSSSSLIQRHDQHIELAAKQASATTLTNDIDLARRLKEIGLPALYPLELFSKYNPGSLSAIFFGERPTSDAGSLFFRGKPSCGADAILEPFAWREFSVRYNYNEFEWEVIVNNETILNTRYKFDHLANLELSVSWTRAEITLRLGDVEHPIKENLAAPIDVDFNQSFQIAPRYNGTIFLSTMDNRPMGKGIWKKSLSDPPYSSPNPYDIDRVRCAIQVFSSP